MTTPRAEAALAGLREVLADIVYDPFTTVAAKEEAVQAEAARLWGCEPEEVQVHYDAEGYVVQVRFPPEKTVIVLTIQPAKEPK